MPRRYMVDLIGDECDHSVAYEPDHRQLLDVVPRQLLDTKYRSPQLALWELGNGEWLKVVRVQPATPRRRLKDALHQQALWAESA